MGENTHHYFGYCVPWYWAKCVTLQLASLPDNAFLIMWENTCGIPSGKTKDSVIQTAQSQRSTPDLTLKEETKENAPKILVVYYLAGVWDLEKLFFSLYWSVFFPQI